MPYVTIIDDEPGFSEALVALLSDGGYQVESAADGQKGLTLLTRRTPDLVLLDFMMPELDGPGVLQAMRKHARLRRVPVVMMSAVDEALVRRRCTGYSEFLHKPFEVVRLMRVMRHLLTPAAALASR